MDLCVKAFSDEDIACDDALQCFLYNQEIHLVMDYENDIFTEYNRYLKNMRLYLMWMLNLDRSQRKIWVSSRLDKSHKKDLLDRKFQKAEDQVFAGAAMNADKFILSEDSDYGVHGEPDKQEVFTYMRDKMGLQVVSAEQFSAEF